MESGHPNWTTAKKRGLQTSVQTFGVVVTFVAVVTSALEVRQGEGSGTGGVVSASGGVGSGRWCQCSLGVIRALRTSCLCDCRQESDQCEGKGVEGVSGWGEGVGE